MNDYSVTANGATAKNEAVEVLKARETSTSDRLDWTSLVFSKAPKSPSRGAIVPLTLGRPGEIDACACIGFDVSKPGVERGTKACSFRVVNRPIGPVYGKNNGRRRKVRPGPKHTKGFQGCAVKRTEAHTAAEQKVLKGSSVRRFIGGFLDKHQLRLTVVAILNILGISNRKSADLVLATHSRAVIQ